jgi:hydroxymethylglutaryl-CoA reductase (NADPH)
MFGFLANRFQTPRAGEQTRPGWFDRHCTPVLLSIAKKACTHPVHTIVTIAVLASYSYLGVLDKGFLDQSDATPGQVDFSTLLAGSTRLRVGQETTWKWETEERRPAQVEQVC